MTEISFEQELWFALCEDNTTKQQLVDLLNIGSLLWQKGWAEANAGNVSYRLPSNLQTNTLSLLKRLLAKSDKNQSDNPQDYYWFLVSASGSRYRQYVNKSFANFVIVGIFKPAFMQHTQTEQVFFPLSRKPTSEWQMHNAVQQWLINNRSSECIILHTHLTDWITLSNLDEYHASPRDMLSTISATLPELDIYLPQSIEFTSYQPPGSVELADVTLKAISKSNVIVWEKHGIVVSAQQFNQAMDYIEVMAKAARIYLDLKLCRN